MARKSTPPAEPTRLTAPRSQVAAELDERVAAGEALKARPIDSPADVDAGSQTKRVMIRAVGPSECKIDANGNLHRELTLNIEQNGVASEGKLVVDISGAK